MDIDMDMDLDMDIDMEVSLVMGGGTPHWMVYVLFHGKSQTINGWFGVPTWLRKPPYSTAAYFRRSLPCRLGRQEVLLIKFVPVKRLKMPSRGGRWCKRSEEEKLKRGFDGVKWTCNISNMPHITGFYWVNDYQANKCIPYSAWWNCFPFQFACFEWETSQQTKGNNWTFGEYAMSVTGLW
jgi:hypothetical protein